MNLPNAKGYLSSSSSDSDEETSDEKETDQVEAMDFPETR